MEPTIHSDWRITRTHDGVMMVGIHFLELEIPSHYQMNVRLN
jgi:hypothetical protein